MCEVKVGGIYKVKVEKRKECGTFNGQEDSKYIRVTNVDCDGDLYYDILNSSQEKTGSTCCVCFKPEDLEQVDTEIKSESPTHKFQIGEKVTVLQGGDSVRFPGGPDWNDDMQRMVGKVMTILNVTTTRSGKIAYKLDEDARQWFWDERWLAPAPKLVRDDDHVGVDFAGGYTCGSACACGTFSETGHTLTAESIEEAVGILTKDNKKTVMSKLTNTFKLLTDKSTQTLRKAGYINGDLELTQEGQAALNSILLAAHKEELVKLAEEKIAEEKAEK
jgi:hypothetical protein